MTTDVSRCSGGARVVPAERFDAAFARGAVPALTDAAIKLIAQGAEVPDLAVDLGEVLPHEGVYRDAVPVAIVGRAQEVARTPHEA